MVWAAIVVGVGTLAYNIYSGSKKRKAAQKEADKAEAEAKRKNKLMEEQKDKVTCFSNFFLFRHFFLYPDRSLVCSWKS